MFKGGCKVRWIFSGIILIVTALYEIIFTATTFNGSFYKIKDYKQNDPWNVERFLEDLLLVVKGQSNLDIDGYL